jgi:hypothetical protein
MKARLLAFGLLASSVLLILLVGCAQSKEQVLYGTWTNEKGGLYSKAVHTPGLIQNFKWSSDTTPSEQEKIRIASCWSDSEGNIWFRIEDTEIGGPFPNTKAQRLAKISKSGTFLEITDNIVADFSPNGFPTKIDPTNPYYMSFSRAAK